MARKPLNLYLVKRETAMTRLDETTGAVICAANGDDALEFAMDLPGDQGRAAWYLPSTTVELIGKATPDRVGGVVFSEYQPA